MHGFQIQTFYQVIGLGDEYRAEEETTDDKAIAAMGILDTLDTLVTVMEEKRQVQTCLITLNYIIHEVLRFLIPHRPFLWKYLRMVCIHCLNEVINADLHGRERLLDCSCFISIHICYKTHSVSFTTCQHIFWKQYYSTNN